MSDELDSVASELDIANDCELWFGTESPLQKAITGFAPRESQLLLAKAIEQAIQDKQVLVAEAGTGTGKTFAYLIPALLSEQQTVISTGTKNLQDQLFFRDIPLLRQALAMPAKISLLKGRSNYICLYRLNHMDQQLFPTKATIKHLQRIRQQLPRTRFGDINEFDKVPDDSPAWSYVTSTRDNCLGQECDYYDDCYLVKARRKALASNVVIINHHLLFADLVLKEEGVGELLPNADLVVLDEAHQVPEIASQFFGVRMSSRQFTELARDTLMEQLSEAKDATQVAKLCDKVNKAMADMRLHMGEQSRRAAWHTIAKQSSLQACITTTQEILAELAEQLELIAGRSKGLENCWSRCQELLSLFHRCTTCQEGESIHWFETFSQSFSIYLTPLSISEPFQELLSQQEKAWVFTSATLTVNDQFDHFSHQLGLAEHQELALPSPFPYEDNCLLYVPKGMPDPNHQQYTEAVVEAAVPLIEANQGRTFFLFTSYRALRIAAELLSHRLNFSLYVQGEKGKDQLIREYTADGQGVLLGTYSFWEGVDVKGDALSCVIIDKLPFQAPDDPVSLARAQALRRQAKDPFQHYQLPKAILGLKQGTGRLIRDTHDVGVMMVCDPRLLARDYGRLFLNSLAPAQRTRNLQTVLSFIKHMRDSS